MPIYEYACSVCGVSTDILHGVNDPAPEFCPACGAGGSLRKAFALPAIHFKGSGWAKRDRRTAAASRSAASPEGSTEGASAAADAGPSEGSAPAPDSKPATAGASGPSDAASGATRGASGPASPGG